MLKITDGRRIPEKERREDDIRQMGDHRLKGLVLRCIEDESDERLNAKEVVDWLQKERSIIERKNTIAQRRTLNRQLPTLKIIPLGESATGKSSILSRYNDDKFPERIVPTIGSVEFRKNITLKGKQFTLRIEDTAGQERFDSITSSFIRDADGVLLIFDVTDRESFKNGIPRMKKLLDRYLDADSASIFLVGNKVDAGDKREVTRKQAEVLAANLGVRYFETSAKTGQNIEKVFEELAEEIYNALDLSDIEKYPQQTTRNAGGVPLVPGKTETNNSWRAWLSSRC